MTPMILGAGPAGSAAAITLAQAGIRAMLIERHREMPDAICGGFLSWRTIRSLAALGIDPAALGDARIGTVRLFAGGRVVEAPLPAPALGVSRRHLDTVLLDSAIRRGVAVERGVAVRAIEPRGLRTADGAILSPDALFLASGKHDVRGGARPAAARGDDPSLGLRWRRGPCATLSRLVGDRIELHLFDRGYAGVVRQEDGSTNICLVVRGSRWDEAGSVASLRESLARESPALGERLTGGDAIGDGDAIANIPYGWRARSGAAGVFRLGDQAAVIPSLAGEGVGIALASGRSAATAFASGGAAAAPAWQRDFARRARRPLAIAAGVRHLAERPARSAGLLPLAARLHLIGMVAAMTRIDHDRTLDHSPNPSH